LLGAIVFLFMAMNKQHPDKSFVGTKILLNRNKVREYFIDEAGVRYYWISMILFAIGLVFSLYELIIKY